MGSTGMHRADQRSRQGGFTLVEAICGVVVLTVALLGHVSSVISEQKLAQDGQTRSEALHVARQFVERMRGDDDFEGMLGYFRGRQLATSGVGADRLDNGRLAFAPSAYYPDFVLPSELDRLVVRIEVPTDPATPLVLRENLDLPYFGLPADLNGDGKIDGAPRDGDYLALPVSLHFSWAAPGHPAQNLKLVTWMRGRR